MRTPVRVTIAVNSANMGISSSNLICRAYSIYWASNDLNGVTQAWWPLQDWRTLPTGVVFSDQAASSYAVVSGNTPPNPGVSFRWSNGGGTLTWQNFENSIAMPVITNITTSVPASMTMSYVEFRPTGEAKCGSTPPQGAAGVRLALGTVTIPGAATPTLVINNTNNWVYVEYDTRNGRVRVRYPESY